MATQNVIRRCRQLLPDEIPLAIWASSIVASTSLNEEDIGTRLTR